MNHSLETTTNSKYLNKYLTLEKIQDKVFNGSHPNGVFIGDKLQGFCNSEPKIGEQFIFAGGVAWTSTVEKIDEENNLLYTKNSVYKIYIHDKSTL